MVFHETADEDSDLTARIRQDLEEHFETVLASDPGNDRAEKLAWRLSCFDSGLRLVNYIEERHFPVAQRQVLDVACGWGGHAIAFAAKGAEVYAADINDHSFSALNRFSQSPELQYHCLRANCEELPFSDGMSDVIIGLELVEHIVSVEKFAQEVARVLRPGGICIITTPAKFRCIYEGEPHYGVRGLAIFPFFLQGLLATRVLRRSYPFPITRQYTFATSVMRPFVSRGLIGNSVLTERLGQLLPNSPILLKLARQLLWNLVIFTKPVDKHELGASK